MKYPYTFTWMGRPVIQFPDDLLRLQEIVFRVQPDVIIETGVAHGGSLIFYASLCKVLGRGRVIGIDVEIRPHNRAAIEAHPLKPFITLIEGSSTDPNVIEKVRALVAPDETVLVILDSNHTAAHVRAELDAYSALVTPGSFIIAMDGYLMELGAPDRPGSNWATDNANAGVRAFAADHPEFAAEEPGLPFNESPLTRAVTGFRGGTAQKDSMTATIAALIPTRNRADLAIAAVRSLLDQDCPIEIFVSDNSTSADGLRDFCLGQKQVHYLRPPTSSPCRSIGIGHSARFSSARRPRTSRSTTTGKCRSRGNGARCARSRRDGRTCSSRSSADFVTIDPPPRRLWQPPWTGKLYSVTTARTAALVAAARINDMGQALPILSNCLIPRTILIRMAQRFGDICNGTSGDAPFLCRYLTLDDRYLHYDRPIGIGYAPQRSAGFGYLRGEGGDFPDYQKIWGERKWLERAPIPGINLGHNMLFHEYEIVREQTGDRLPPIDFDAYLRALGEALRHKTDAAERES